METFDLYDENLNKLPRTMVRGGTNNKGEYHLVVHIWIKNAKGQYLIQQRNKQEDIVPYQWAVTSGAVLSGETALEGAMRETKEELGLTFTKEQFTLLKQGLIEDPKANYITYLYIVQEDILLKDCKIDTVEVRDIAYKTMPEIKQMIADNKFWDYERNLKRNGYYSLLEKS